MRRLLTAQLQIARDLHAAFGAQLDEADAIAITGAAVGALVGVALRGMERGDGAERMRSDMKRAITMLDRGLGAIGTTPAQANSGNATR